MGIKWLLYTLILELHSTFLLVLSLQEFTEKGKYWIFEIGSKSNSYDSSEIGTC